MEQRIDNQGFVSDDIHHAPRLSNQFRLTGSRLFSYQIDENSVENRENWGKGIEFLLSCIAMSVGLGNVWRFPFIALQNGGGAFVIPYIIILVLVGKPGYFLEMIMGQFSSRGPIKVYDCAPAMRGVGFGQIFGLVCISTYYSSVMAITLRYFFYSFNSELPWSVCDAKWTEPCYPASTGVHLNETWANGTRSSSELYFLKEVLHAHDSLHEGVGVPSLNLIGFLVLAWMIIFLILFKGIRFSGKFSYVTGIAPFIFLFVFLVRALTLPGALDGIKYFFTPKWEDILKPTVWYAACTQLFFSLNVFFSNVIMYSSYNKFDQKIYRDSNIVTTLDTFTSLLAGCITFGIIGHLALELNVEIPKVFRGGPGLVFITYAETISKFAVLPQFFSIMFFLMLFILSMGSLIAMTSCIITVIRDQFKGVKTWQAALGYSIFGVIVGSIYTTPSGQSILNLVDHYGGTFIFFMLAVFEMITFSYIYGVNRVCKDVEFMLGYRPGIFWRATWWFITPVIMAAIVIFSFVNYENPKDNANEFPALAHVIGWCIAAAGLIWLPLLLVLRVLKKHKNKKSLREKLKDAFRPTLHWGPRNEILNVRYREFMKES